MNTQNHNELLCSTENKYHIDELKHLLSILGMSRSIANNVEEELHYLTDAIQTNRFGKDPVEIWAGFIADKAEIWIAPSDGTGYRAITISPLEEGPDWEQAFRWIVDAFEYKIRSAGLEYTCEYLGEKD